MSLKEKIDKLQKMGISAKERVSAININSTMTDAANQSLVGEQTEFATNTLTLIVPKGNPAGITGLDSSQQ